MGENNPTIESKNPLCQKALILIMINKNKQDRRHFNESGGHS